MAVSDKSIEQLANAVSNLTKTVNQTVSSEKATRTKLEQLLEFLAKDATRKEKLDKEREVKQNAKRESKQKPSSDSQSSQTNKKELRDKKQNDKKSADEAFANLKKQGDATKKLVSFIEDKISSLDDRRKKPEVKSKELIDRLKKSNELPKKYLDKIEEVSDLLIKSIKISESLAKPSRASSFASNLSSKIFQMPEIVSEIPFRIEESLKKIQMKGVYKRIDEATKVLNEMEKELKSQKGVFETSSKEASNSTNDILDSILDVLSDKPKDESGRANVADAINSKLGGQSDYGEINSALDSILDALSNKTSPEVNIDEVTRNVYKAMDGIVERFKGVEETKGIDIKESIDDLIRLTSDQYKDIENLDERYYAENAAILREFTKGQDLFLSWGVNLTEEIAAATKANEDYYKYIKDKDKDIATKVKFTKRETVTNFADNYVDGLKKDSTGFFDLLLIGIGAVAIKVFEVVKGVKSFFTKSIPKFLEDIGKIGIFSTVKERFVKFAKFADDFTGGFFSKLGNVFVGIKDFAMKPFIWISEKLKGISSMSIDSVKTWFSGVFGKLGSFFKDIGNSKVVKGIEKVFSLMGEKLGFLLKPLGKIASIASKVYGAILLPIQLAASMFDVFTGFSNKKAIEAFGDIKDTVTNADSVVMGLSTFVVEMVSGVLNFFTIGLFELVTDWLFGEDWQEKLSVTFARFFDWIGSSIGSGLFKMVDYVESLFSKGTWADLGNTITNALIWVANIIPNVINTIIDTVAYWASSLPGMSNIVPAKVPTIPYANVSFDKKEAGGPLSKGVVTKVGEKGPEFIVSNLDGLKVLNHNQTVQTENNLKKIEKNVYEKEKIIDNSGSVEEMVALAKRFSEYLSMVNKPIENGKDNTQAPVVNNINNYSSSTQATGQQNAVVYIHSGSIFDKLVKEF